MQNIPVSRTKEQTIAMNVMEGKDSLSSYVKDEIRARPVLAGHATKIMQINRQVMMSEFKERQP